MFSDILKVACLLAGFVLWGLLAYLKMVPVEPLISLLQMGLGGLVTHLLTSMQGTQVPVMPPIPPTATVSGFTSLRMLLVLACVALGLTLAGCSTVMRGYEASAANEIKQANDNALSVWKQLGCALPVGAVIRSPDVIDAVNKFCGGGSSILGAQQPITVNVTMPPAVAASAPK